MGVERSGNGLGAAYGGFQNEQILGGLDIGDKLANEPRYGRECGIRRRAVLANGIAVVGLDQAQFMDIARQRGLARVHASMAERALQLPLAGNALLRHERENGFLAGGFRHVNTYPA